MAPHAPTCLTELIRLFSCRRCDTLGMLAAGSKTRPEAKPNIDTMARADAARPPAGWCEIANNKRTIESSADEGRFAGTERDRVRALATKLCGRLQFSFFSSSGDRHVCAHWPTH
jgi:hypothetical protein